MGYQKVLLAIELSTNKFAQNDAAWRHKDAQCTRRFIATRSKDREIALSLMICGLVNLKYAARRY